MRVQGFSTMFYEFQFRFSVQFWTWARLAEGPAMHSGIAYPPSNEPQGSPAGAETQATEVPYEADACVKAGT